MTGIDPTSAGSAFSLRGATVLRNDQKVLDTVDIALSEGDALVLSGPNGAGKTSLMRVIAGLMPLTDGKAWLFGRPFPPGRSTRVRVATALDEPSFWPWMSAYSVVRTVCDLAGTRAPDISSQLEEVGLDGSRRVLFPRAKRVSKFSQGMRKRLQVACALVLSRDLLLIDEPTASLDADGCELVWSAFERRVASGTTLVVASHDEDAAARLGARHIAMSHGRLISPVTTGAA